MSAQQSIDGRYRVEEVLGKGGLAVVYRVHDSRGGVERALKRLSPQPTETARLRSVELFEREFHTLAALSHPRVIEVYDYGLDEEGPYYTMELLDGGDLRTRSPLPWKQACSLVHDVCSSLALIHSRRFVHRDVTPGNVRCTHDGHAKLIDFGAMAPMGRTGLVVGTPQFIAPEVVHRSNLDARADLFSLGATLYYALTGRSPYPAKNLASVQVAWERKPAAPSQYAADIPEALDALVLSLIALDAALRPRTAFEVMHRLAAIAGIERAEPISVSRAYLATPVIVGREGPLGALSSAIDTALEGHGGGTLIEGPAGAGRSRMLEESALAAKARGAIVLRASGTIGQRGNFRVAATLVEQLVESVPGPALKKARKLGVHHLLFASDASDQPTPGGQRPRGHLLEDWAANPGGRFEIQKALSDWFLAMARRRRIVVAVDDLHRVDEPSAAFLAGLVSRLAHHPVLLVATAEADAAPVDRLAFDVFARHSARVQLAPLARRQTEQLFESVFGDVANVAVVSARIHAIAGGNPRASLDIAQHLVDRGLVRYERGGWTLPAELAPDDLPANAEEAIQVRIGALQPLSRFLAEAQALATHQTFAREDYAKLRPDASSLALDHAIMELVSHQVVVGDGRVYTLAHAGFAAALDAALSAEDRRERHHALVSLHEGRGGLGLVRHALLAGLEQRALDELAPLLSTLPEATKFYETTDLSPSDIAATFERALAAAERCGRSGRERCDLRRWLASLSVIADDRYYYRAAPEWLAQLKRDSGYLIWEELHEITDRQARTGKALQLAFERFGATPEAERVYRPDEAIKGLAHYVGISLAIGSARIDRSLIATLPAVLEPFASLSPLIDVIWQNAIAACEASVKAQPERSRERWKVVHRRLGELEGQEPTFIGVFRRAVAHAIGSNEAMLGLPEAAAWAKHLDDDPVQRVNGLYLRRVVRLQQGDWDGAERFRRRAEVLNLQTRARQMFNSLTPIELVACWMGHDLTGLKQVHERVKSLAERSPGWAPFVALGEGYFHLLCEDFSAAVACFERGLELVRSAREVPTALPNVFYMLCAGNVEALVGLERHEEARALGEDVLETCRELEVGVVTHGISRALALAEAKLGDHAGAASRLESVIATQSQLGIAGLHLGASFEARARVAMLAGDAAGLDTYARLTAREYRYGANSPLGARYERLMRDARRAAGTRLPALTDVDRSAVCGSTGVTGVTEAVSTDGAASSCDETTGLERCGS